MIYQPTITKKLNIGVFFGSRSPEHDISVITGQMVIESLNKTNKYKITPIYINKNGKWLISEKLGNINFFKDPDFEKNLEELGNFSLDIDGSKGFLRFYPEKRGLFSGNEPIIVDVAFPAFHGSYGEDGTIQGLFEILNVPYVGCGVLSSALALDKIISREILAKQGFSVARNIWFDEKEFDSGQKQILKEIEEKIPYPLFVKPNKLGSSIGISKVKNQKELKFAIEVAFQFDEKVIVEETIQNLMEVNCAVIGNDEPIASLPEQPFYKQAFQTFEEKYQTKGGTIKKGAKKNVIPAPLKKEKLEEIQNLSKKAYQVLGCSGISRIDFLVDTGLGKVYINEINTLPGTLQIHLWEASGISKQELVDKLINYALERFNKNKKLVYVFNSNLLNS